MFIIPQIIFIKNHVFNYKGTVRTPTAPRKLFLRGAIQDVEPAHSKYPLATTDDTLWQRNSHSASD